MELLWPGSMFFEKLVDVFSACDVELVLGWLLRMRLEFMLLAEVSAFGVWVRIFGAEPGL